MAEDRPLVRNAADPRQVGNAARKERDAREVELAELRAIAGTAIGRAVLWRILEQCRTFGSVWDVSGSRIHYNAGQQDIGHFLIAEITAADEELLFTMMREARDRKSRLATEAEAVRTAKADTGANDGE